MTNPAAISTLNIQTVASKYHGLVEETGFFGEIVASRAEVGNTQDNVEHLSHQNTVSNYTSHIKRTLQPA